MSRALQTERITWRAGAFGLQRGFSAHVTVKLLLAR
jgi:hypothetical protein